MKLYVKNTISTNNSLFLCTKVTYGREYHVVKGEVQEFDLIKVLWEICYN